DAVRADHQRRARTGEVRGEDRVLGEDRTAGERRGGRGGGDGERHGREAREGETTGHGATLSTPSQADKAPEVGAAATRVPRHCPAMRGVVAAGHPLTAQAGADVLRAGGTAVDA